MTLLALIFLLQQPEASANPVCGETWNTSWILHIEQEKITKNKAKFFKQKYCDPKPPKNANVKFAILNRRKKVVYQKKIFVSFKAYYDEVNKKNNKLTGGSYTPKKNSVLVKYPRTPNTTTGKYIRFTKIKNNKILGTHEI